MRRAARAIVIHDNKLLVMHRNKFGKEYLTLPGGNIEIGETPEQAMYRELAEETTVTVTEPRLVIIEHAGDPYGDQYIFQCKYVEGEPQLKPGSEEELINKLGQNIYTPMWVPLAELSDTPFVSEELKQTIIDHLTKDFPAEPITLRWHKM